MNDDGHNGLDLGKLMGLVFIDLKQAFDTDDHDILCKNTLTAHLHQAETQLSQKSRWGLGTENK